MGMKFSFALLAVIIAMAGGFAWYFKLTQAKIDVLVENAAVLESVTNTQKATITELQASAEKQAQQTQDLAAKLAAAETSNRKIAFLFMIAFCDCLIIQIYAINDLYLKNCFIFA